MLQRLRRITRHRKRHEDSKRRPSFPTLGRPGEAEPAEQQDGPVCKCGEIVKYAGNHICEDCFVDMQIRWPGKATRVRIFL